VPDSPHRGEDAPRLVLDTGGPTSTVADVLFTPDGKYLVTASLDKTIRVINVVTGRTERSFRLASGGGKEGVMGCLAFSPDGKILAAAGHAYGSGKYGSPIYLIDFETGEVLRLLQGHRTVIYTLDFNSTGTLLASGSVLGDVIIHRVDTGKMTLRETAHTSLVRHVCFHPNDKVLATCSLDTTIKFWDLTGPSITSKTLARETTREVNAIAWSPAGGVLASGGEDGTVRLWKADGTSLGPVFSQDVTNAQTGQERRAVVAALEFSRDGEELVFGGLAFSGTLNVYNLKTKTHRLNLTHHTNTVQTVAVSPDGKLAASAGGNDHETYIWSLADGEIVHTVRGEGSGVMAVGWHPDGKRIVWGNTNFVPFGRIYHNLERCFDTEQLAFQEFHGRLQYYRSVLEQGEYALEQADQFTFNFKKNNKTYLAFKLPSEGGPEAIWCASLFGPDRVLIGGDFGLYLVDLHTGRILRKYRGHSMMVTSISPHPDGKLFMTGSVDQTICVWSPDNEQPLVTYFFAGQNWICWAPEGYYACSPYGERLMGWQVNHGLDKMASYYPAVQFRQSLYHPEVMKVLLKAGTLRQALVQAGVDPRGQALSVESVLPPRVAITVPAPQGRVKIQEETFQVKAVAHSIGQHPVVSLRLLVDGRPYLGERGVVTVAQPGLGEAVATWEVKLPPGGEYLLSVQAVSSVSKGLSPVLNVVQGGQPIKPNLYVLAFGIAAYPGELKLNYAASDAELLTRTLQEHSRDVFETIEVRVITDAEATRKGIHEGLEWIKSKMTARDVGIIFFSGHGTQDEKGDFYMVPVDVRGDDLAGSCFPGDVFKQTLENLPGRVIAMLDCCHSGSVAENKPLVPRVADDLVRDLVTDDYGVIVMCSSLGQECSLESPAVKAGFYTRGLVEGMEGAADVNRDNLIHVHELDQFTSLFVRKLTQGMQNPVTGLPRDVRSFPIARK
jgi:WD40 repeat protein